MGGAERVPISWGNHSLSNRVEEAVRSMINFIKKGGPKGWDDPWGWCKCMLVIEQLLYDFCLHGPRSEQTSSNLCAILEDLYYPTNKSTTMSIQIVVVPSKKFSFWSSSLQVGHWYFCWLSISNLLQSAQIFTFKFSCQEILHELLCFVGCK